MAKDIGVDTCIFHTSSNDEAQCPGCYGNDTSIIGRVIVEDSEQNVRKCNSCSRMFSKLGNDEKQFMDSVADGVLNGNEARAKYVQINPATAAHDIQDVNVNASGGCSETQLDYDSKNKIEQLGNNIVSLQDSIDTLACDLRNLLEENRRAMEKQKGDPLIGLRKSIFDFNLE